MLPSPKCPKATDAQTGHRCKAGRARRLDEVGDAGDRHRDVVLDRAALADLHLGQALAQVPEGAVLRLARGDGRVGEKTILHGGAEHALIEAFEVGIGLRRGQLDEGVPGMLAGERAHGAGSVLQNHLEAESRKAARRR